MPPSSSLGGDGGRGRSGGSSRFGLFRPWTGKRASSPDASTYSSYLEKPLQSRAGEGSGGGSARAESATMVRIMTDIESGPVWGSVLDFGRGSVVDLARERERERERNRDSLGIGVAYTRDG